MLIRAIADEGSIGGAARRLHISQPSASARLSSVERRCGSILFARDTTGARATPAGEAMTAQATHILGHLDGVYAAVRAADRRPLLRVGTFASLAPSLFPSLEQLIDEPVHAQVSHGPDLVHRVAEGSLDAAVVDVAEQMVLPRQVRVHPLGEDSLTIFRRAGTPGIGSGRQPFADRRVLVATYDQHGDAVIERLTRLGAAAEHAATLPTAIAMVKRTKTLAVVPRSALAHHVGRGDRQEELPFRQRIRLSLVTPREGDARLTGQTAALAVALHLERASG